MAKKNKNSSTKKTENKKTGDAKSAYGKKSSTKKSEEKKVAKKAGEKKNSDRNNGYRNTADFTKDFKKSAPKRKKAEPFVNHIHLTVSEMSSEVIHGQQVSSLAYEVGLELGLPESDLKDLIIAGFFHDIGKTALAEEQLTEQTMMVEEMNSIREHPAMGYEILKRHGYSENICSYVRSHHENADGSGYPDNLDGSKIPLGACILRVCDVFCALVQDRPYRSAFSMETAVNMMIEEVEKYDLKVFLAFQRVLHRPEDGHIEMPQVRPYVRGVWKTL